MKRIALVIVAVLAIATPVTAKEEVSECISAADMDFGTHDTGDFISVSGSLPSSFQEVTIAVGTPVIVDDGLRVDFNQLIIRFPPGVRQITITGGSGNAIELTINDEVRHGKRFHSIPTFSHVFMSYTALDLPKPDSHHGILELLSKRDIRYISIRGIEVVIQDMCIVSA